MKKTLLKTIGIALAAVCVIAPAKNVSAMVGMPCTNIIINNGTAAYNDAVTRLAQANAAVAQAEAAYNNIINNGGNDMEKTQAFLALNQAKAVAKTCQDQVQVAQMNVRDASANARNEQYFLDMTSKWAGRVYIDNENTAVNNAQGQATAALAEVNRLKQVIAQAQTVDSLKASIPGLQADLAKAEANYAALKAQADAMSSQYKSDLSNVNWATNDDSANYVNYVQYIKDTYLKDDPVAYAHGCHILHWYN